MEPPMVINAWLTVREAEEAGVSTSSPNSYRFTTGPGKLHRARCGILDRVRSDDQLFLADPRDAAAYLKEKGLKLDDVKCGLCCRNVRAFRGRRLIDPRPEKEQWWEELEAGDKMAVFERLMVGHHEEIHDLVQTLK